VTFEPDFIDGLLELDGPATADVWDAMAAEPVVRITTVGACTLRLDLEDPDRDVRLRRLAAEAAGLTWTLAAVRRTGDRLQLVLEDDTTTALRRSLQTVAAPAGVTTVAEVAERITQKAGVALLVEPTRTTLAAGFSHDGSAWDALRALASEVGWWRMAGPRLTVASAEWLLTRPPATEREDDEFDFAFDVAKDFDTASVLVEEDAWTPDPGEVTLLDGEPWLLASYTYRLGEDMARVVWTRPAVEQPWR